MSPESSEGTPKEAEIWRINDEISKSLKSIDENVYKGVRLLAALVDVLSRYEQESEETDMVPSRTYEPSKVNDPVYAVADLINSLLRNDQ